MYQKTSVFHKISLVFDIFLEIWQKSKKLPERKWRSTTPLKISGAQPERHSWKFQKSERKLERRSRKNCGAQAGAPLRNMTRTGAGARAPKLCSSLTACFLYTFFQTCLWANLTSRRLGDLLHFGKVVFIPQLSNLSINVNFAYQKIPSTCCYFVKHGSYSSS